MYGSCVCVSGVVILSFFLFRMILISTSRSGEMPLWKS